MPSAEANVGRRERLSIQERCIERAQEWCSVFVEAYPERTPRFFGDNDGVWPVRVRTSVDPSALVNATDRSNGIHSVELYTHVWIKTEARAKQLKARLDLKIPDSTRHGWKDVQDPWHVIFLLGDAGEELGFELCDDEQKLAHIRKEVRRQMNLAAKGRQK